jgi:hypothetical protein
MGQALTDKQAAWLETFWAELAARGFSRRKIARMVHGTNEHGGASAGRKRNLAALQTQLESFANELQWQATAHKRLHRLLDVPTCDLATSNCRSRSEVLKLHTRLRKLLVDQCRLKATTLEKEYGTFETEPAGEGGLGDFVTTLHVEGCSFRQIGFLRLWLQTRARPIGVQQLDSAAKAAKAAHHANQRQFLARMKRLRKSLGLHGRRKLSKG